MIKVKVFSVESVEHNRRADKLENQINSYLEENPSIEIVDIKLSSAYSGANDVTCAVLIYKTE